MSSTTSTSTATSNAAVSAAAAGGDQDDETTANLHVRRDWYSTVATFISGGVAGAASRTLTAPLDRVKTIVQEGHLVPSTPQHQNLTSWKNAKLLDVARLIRADGGWRAFWRGNMVNCLKAGPEFAIVFSLRRYFSSLYEEGLEEEQRRSKAASARWKERLEVEKRERAQRESLTGIVEEVEELTPAERAAARRRFMDEESALFPPPLHHLSLHHIPRLMVNCTIGAAAGIGAQSILYPMEVVKTRVCVSRSNEIRGGVRDIITDAYRAGGIQEFYKGFAPNLVGIFVYRGLEMGIYSSLQQSLILYRMQWKHLSRHDASLSTAEVGGVGMFASMIAQTVSYPLNVVRTKLQTQGSNGRQKQYNGMVDCFTQIVRRKGVCALFSGLMANYLKALPASACTFIVFEKVQQVLVGDD